MKDDGLEEVKLKVEEVNKRNLKDLDEVHLL